MATRDQVTPVAEQVTTQAEGQILDPPGEGQAEQDAVVEEAIPEGLDEEEQGQYATFVKGFREAVQIFSATGREEILTEILKATESDPKLSRLWWHTSGMSRALEPIGHMSDQCRSPRAIEAALRSLLAEVRKVLNPADEFASMEAEIRGAVKNLPPKIKAVVGILVELASLESLSIEGTEFPNKILYADLTDDDAIREAIAETGDDPDMKVLSKAYDLAEQIIQND